MTSFAERLVRMEAHLAEREEDWLRRDFAARMHALGGDAALSTAAAGADSVGMAALRGAANEASATTGSAPHKGRTMVAAQYQAQYGRDVALLRQLHDVGLCADHASDASSGDEALVDERRRHRDATKKTRAEHTAQNERRDQQERERRRELLSGRILQGAHMQQHAMHRDRDAEAERQAKALEGLRHRHAAAVRRILRRKADKRQLERALHTCLHTPIAAVVASRPVAGDRTGISTPEALVAVIGPSAAVALPTRSEGTVGTKRPREQPQTSTSASALNDLFSTTGLEDTAVKNFRTRAAQLLALRRQEDFAGMAAPDKPAAELSAVMERRQRFHRQRGAAGKEKAGGGVDNDFGDAD